MRPIDADKIPYVEAVKDTLEPSGKFYARREDIRALPTIEPEPQWIPCSERLPEPDERVLVYTVANEYHVWDAMTHRGEGYQWEDEEGLCHSLYEVEMWLPLPEPYQAERREE